MINSTSKLLYDKRKACIQSLIYFFGSFEPTIDDDDYEDDKAENGNGNDSLFHKSEGKIDERLKI